jgi:hypothetical protein
VSKQYYSGELDKDHYEVQLITYHGEGFDIKGIVSKILITENIFTHTLTGSLIIDDGVGLIEKAPIIGSEKILITFKNPAAKILNALEFRITSIANRKPKEGTRLGVTYILNIKSEESIINSTKRISQSYKGNIGQIVKKIYDDHLKTKKRGGGDEGMDVGEVIDSNDSNDLNVNTTEFSGYHKFIVPNWTPFQAIRYLSSRAVTTQSSAANCYFYETLGGFHFKFIDSLIRLPSFNQNKPYKYEIKNVPDAGATDVGEIIFDSSVEKEMFGVTDFKILSSFPDSQESIAHGMYAGTLITHDIVRKKIERITYNYIKGFGTTAHAGRGPWIPEKGMSFTTHALESKPFEASSSNILLHPKHKNLHNNDENVDSNRVQDWLLQRLSFQKQMVGTQIEILVPGNSDISVGDMINFDLHIFAGKIRTQNPWLTGKYFLGKLTHEFNPDKYMMKMRLYKDSFTSFPMIQSSPQENVSQKDGS